MKKYLVIAAVFIVLGLLGAGGYAIEYAIDKAATAETAAAQAVDANKVTTATLERTANATKKLVDVTGALATDVQTLAKTTKTGMAKIQKGLANEKAINLDAVVSADVVSDVCVQWATASGQTSGMAGKALSGTSVPTSPHALAEQCKTAWARVTWRDLIEYIMPLMEHSGQLRLQLEAGAAYYAPQKK